MNTAKALPTPATDNPIRITHGGETRYANAATWQAVCDEMIAKHGPGVPNVTDTSRAPAPAPKALPQPGAGERDILGEARATIDFAGAEDGGFAPAQSVYRRGTRVNATGVENARIARAEHDALPTVAAACQAFEGMIAGETRRDVTAVSKELRMDASGRLVLPGGARLPMTERAFTSLVAAHHSGIGGGAYLARCWPKLRALNVNHWLTKIGADELAVRNALPAAEVDAWQPSSLTLRTRKGAKPGVTEVFGVVSPSYTAFDVDKIARAIAIAMPKEARAEITYDGQRASFDIRFHSKVKPEHYVAGEFFRAGIRVRTDDTGGGAIQVSSTIWQNLCLNLIIIDEQTQGLARIRHVGSVDELAKRLATALKDAKGTLAHFLKAWDYAVTDTIDATTVDAEPGVEVPSRIEDLLPGIFLGLAQRELVPIRRPKEAIPQLMKMWGEDTSAAAGATRGAVVNAITRYAHTVNEDPWHEDELERAAGRILYGTRGTPAPLPYVPVEA